MPVCDAISPLGGSEGRCVLGFVEIIFVVPWVYLPAGSEVWPEGSGVAMKAAVVAAAALVKETRGSWSSGVLACMCTGGVRLEPLSGKRRQD